MSKIKATALLEKTREVARKNPDFVYTDEFPGRPCKYALDGKPACIVGHALHELGMDLTIITKEEEYWSEGGISASGLFSNLKDHFENDDDWVLGLLDEIQTNQDIGARWAEAAGIEGEEN